MWADYISGLPSECVYPKYVGMKRGTICGQLIEDPLERQKHLHSHLCRRSTGRLYSCKISGCSENFSTLTPLADHLLSEHAVCLGHASASLNVWCRYCEAYVWEGLHTSARGRHFERHMDDAIDIVRVYGYGGYSVSDGVTKSGTRQFVPCSCIFCLHNPHLTAEERIALPFLYGFADDLRNHLRSHLDTIDDNTSVFCPSSAAAGAEPSFCTFAKTMNQSELETHLKIVHGLCIAPKRNKPCKPEHTRKRFRTALQELPVNASQMAPASKGDNHDKLDPTIDPRLQE